MAWLTRMFWTFDIFGSFLTGYMTHDGFIELRPRMIARRYTRSWFLLDMLIVSTDWMEVIFQAMEGVGGIARMGKVSRTFRIVRLLRLLRLARMREVIQIIIERVNSEKVVVIAGSIKWETGVLAMAHLFACLWFAIGNADRLDSWVEVFDYKEATMAQQYLVSLHWSIAQFAGGMDEVTPENTRERAFAIAVFTFCFIVAAMFVSSITSQMTQLNIIGSHTSQQLSSLRRYLHQHGISSKLAVRVQRNAQSQLAESARNMPESQVALLQVVSEPLRVEIHLEMYAPVLMVHPFFRRYITECQQVMRKVCHSATSLINISVGDTVFSHREIPSQPKMYLIINGYLGYTRYLDNGDAAEQEILIGDGQWCSEAALWTLWMHHGTLVAQSDVRFCVVDSHIFTHIVGQFSHGEFDPRKYAAKFVEMLNVNQEQDKLSDLPPGTSFRSIEELKAMQAKKVTFIDQLKNDVKNFVKNRIKARKAKGKSSKTMDAMEAVAAGLFRAVSMRGSVQSVDPSADAT